MLTKMFLEKKESYMFLAIFRTALDVVLYVNFTVRIPQLLAWGIFCFERQVPAEYAPQKVFLL